MDPRRPRGYGGGVAGHRSPHDLEEQRRVGDARRERALGRQLEPRRRGVAADNPAVGFSPTRPQKAAGIRIDPPPSVPVASGARPAASAAPLPPLEPPGDHSMAQGLPVSPKSRFEVKPSNANSGRFVLPTTIAPAARSRATISQSRSAGAASRRRSDPKVVGKPATCSLSLTSRGSPARGPGFSPAPTRASIAAASARASAPRVDTTEPIGTVEPLDAFERLGHQRLGRDTPVTDRGGQLVQHHPLANGTTRAPSFQTCSMRDS